ncbi:MAG: putative endonuclease Z1 domain-containing [Bacteroidetes bacterium]|nr:MAG: putative endonuclease Z1 domain-containing [Bacteroidota bacterium]
MENKYIDVIIKIISSKAKEYSKDNSLSPNYFMNLLPEIKNSITAVINFFGYPEIDEVTLKNYYETAKNQYLSVTPIDIDPSNSLTKKGFRTWLTAERKEQLKNSWNYSDRYFTLLEKVGRSDKVIEETKNTSLEILEKMEDPKSTEAFYTKGLVVGNVQAGKTQNFNAVINRAIDAGYELIIVLAGLMEDLRNQTQLRIENDVVGEGLDIDTDALVTKGVGKIRRFGNQGDTSIRQIISITSAKSDFKKSLLDADFTLSHTNILVCKKNVSVLRNLIVWLHDYLEENKDQHNIPLLVLDDEADNASLNNEGKKGREYASKTNGHIRALLALFKKKTYLGYTATPFANVLADRNDAPENNWPVKYKLRGQHIEKSLPQESNLFPDDFIVLLNPPSNYIGAQQIFETLKPLENKVQQKIPLVEIVKDSIENFPNRVYSQDNGELMGVLKINSLVEWEERFGPFGSYLDFADYKEYRRLTRASRAGDDFPRNLPDSIKESILCFILSIAIRESRKPAMINSTLFNPHNSMLIHISRFTLWQNQLKDLIDIYMRELQSSLQLDEPSNPNSIFATFEKIWYKYFSVIIEHIINYLPKGYDDDFLKPISFETIRNTFLVDAIKDIEVKAINSLTGDKLVYPKKTAKKYIAIGGNRLSRGFTLEGLSINYFVRSTDYSDTLLQMGRWFGYRPGYLDCCKLFITHDSMEKYDLVSRTIEELEIEFRKMEEKGKTPENFVLRVKKHPGTLKITRPSILKDTKEVNWSYQDELEQTTKFDISKEKIEKVWWDFKNRVLPDFDFKQKLNDDGSDAGFLTAETDIAGIIKVLQMENNYGKDTCDSIIRFIQLCKEKNKLTKWTIAIKTTGKANEGEGKGILNEAETGITVPIRMTVRRGPKNEPASKTYRDNFIFKKVFGASGKSANLISAGLDLSVLLSKSQIKDAEKEFIENRRIYYRKKYPDWDKVQIDRKAKGVNIPERVYREKMSDQEGLLVIYILDSHYVFLQEKDKEKDPDFKKIVEDNQIDLNIPLVGYAIGFPPIEPDPGGVYVHGDYGFEDEEESEYNEADSELPDDANEL